MSLFKKNSTIPTHQAHALIAKTAIIAISEQKLPLNERTDLIEMTVSYLGDVAEKHAAGKPSFRKYVSWTSASGYRISFSLGMSETSAATIQEIIVARR